MVSLTSPVKAPSAIRLPATRLPEEAKLVIRVDDTGVTDRIIVSTDPSKLVSASAYNFFVNAGESLEIQGKVLTNLSNVSILATSGTPDIVLGIA